jgi:iron complex outermembrane receptor protein
VLHLLGLSVLLSVGFADICLAAGLKGVVADESGKPLGVVSVSIPAVHRGAVTSDAGEFTIEHLSPGVYSVEFSLIGYRKDVRSVAIDATDVELRIVLHQTALDFPGIVVTGKPQPTDALMSPQSVTAIDGEELDRLRGQNVIEAIENTPGVSTFTTGAGIAKPVIRGLTSQRVLVISDGTRQEGQGWGDEHAPEIDAFNVDRIEVLRGPGSILYGSDAIGGVVNIVTRDLPSADHSDPRLGANLTIDGFHNNEQVAGDVSLFGTNGPLGYRGHLSLRDSKNITTPDGELFNSGVEEQNGGGLLGTKGEWGVAMLDYAHVGQELQIHEDPAEDPAATPFQEIRHDRLHFHGDFPTHNVRFETDASWQRNRRKEFEEETAADPALHLKLDTYSLDVRGHHSPIGHIFGTVGVSLMSQKNQTLAEEKLIPGSDLLNLAGYVFEEARVKDVTLSAAIRYDSRSLEVKDTPELNVTAQTLDYTAVTGAAGVAWRVSEPVAFAVNVARGWRAPTAFELFVDGVHEGTVQYLIGDANLENEASINVDLSLRWASNRAQGEVTLFRNQVDNYIFASPTGEVDTASGFDKYQLTQADAVIQGIEASTQAQVNDWLVLSAGADVIRGTNDQTDKPLPLIPANRLRLGARVSPVTNGRLANPYVSLGAKLVDEQDRVDDFETTTPGYALFDAGVGAELRKRTGNIRIDLSVENVFDQAYREHLSRYKNYALNMGRNIALKVTIPVTIVQ